MNEKVKEAIDVAIEALRHAYNVAVDEECTDSFIEEVSTAYNIMEELK